MKPGIERDYAPPLADAEEGARLRVVGETRALSPDRLDEWKQKGAQWLANQPSGFEFTSDRIPRPNIVSQNNNNAVGALISSWARKGLIVWTERVIGSTLPQNHGAIVKVWRKA